MAGYICSLAHNELPDKVVEIAKTRILDALSCAYDGHSLSNSQLIIDLVKGSRGKCTVFGCGKKAALMDAVMANSALVHSTMQVDNLPLAGHPSTMIVPVAISVGEQERVSGKEVVVAIVLGYEVTQRIGQSIMPVMAKEAVRIGPLAGTLGAAAVAGRLMKLDKEKLANALGYAANLAPGALNQSWWAGTIEPPIHAGAASQTAVLSAVLAGAGAKSAPDTIEGTHGFLNAWAGSTRKSHLITDGLGDSFAVNEVTVKPYPALAGAQSAIQTALPLAESRLKEKDIREVVQKAGPGAHSYPGSNFTGPFNSHYQAIISVPFCVAAAILGRPVESVDLYARHYDDPEVNLLAGKIKLVEESQRTRPRTEVYTHDGRAFIAEEETLDLDALSPSRENMERRFMDKAPALIGEDKARQIVEIVMNLDNIEDVRELTVKL